MATQAAGGASSCHEEAPLEYKWEQARRRKEGAFAFSINGLGPKGTYTLMVGDPKPTTRYKFSGGKPIPVTGGGSFETAEFAELREKVIRSMAFPGASVIEVGAELLEYAAAVLLKSYDLTDAELEELLVAGKGWIPRMIEHLCGGEGYLEQVGKVAPFLTTRLELTSAIRPRMK